MDQDETWHAGRPRPRRLCVRWRPSSPSKKGHSPQFSAHVYCGQTAGWMKTPLGTEVYLGPGHTVWPRSPILAAAEVLFVCVWNISVTAERICSQIHIEVVFGPSTGRVWRSRWKVKGQSQGHQGQKRYFSALSAAWVQFMFGKTSLASSFVCLFTFSILRVFSV